MLATNLRRGAGGRVFEVVHTASAAPGATSWTITSAALGAAQADRRIVVAFMGFVAASFTFTSVTIGGVSATIHGVRTNSSIACCIASAVVPSGATGNVVITGSQNITQGRACIYRAPGFGIGTATTNALSSVAAISTTQNTGVNGVTIFSGVAAFGSIGTYTATGNFTKNDYLAGTGTATMYGAWSRKPTSGGSETNTITWSSVASLLTLVTVNFT